MIMASLGGPGPTAAPSAPDPPTNVSLYLPYGEGGSGGFGEAVEFGIQWANGDITAGTQIVFSGDGSPDGTETPIYYVGPGTTQYDISLYVGDTLDDDYTGWYVRHALGGLYSSWVGYAEL